MSMKSGQPIPFPVRRKPVPEIAPRRRGRPASLAEIPGQPSSTQRDWLAEHGCGELQGYLLGRPAPFEDVVANIKAQRG